MGLPSEAFCPGSATLPSADDKHAEADRAGIDEYVVDGRAGGGVGHADGDGDVSAVGITDGGAVDGGAAVDGDGRGVVHVDSDGGRAGDCR